MMRLQLLLISLFYVSQLNAVTNDSTNRNLNIDFNVGVSGIQLQGNRSLFFKIPSFYLGLNSESAYKKVSIPFSFGIENSGASTPELFFFNV